MLGFPKLVFLSLDKLIKSLKNLSTKSLLVLVSTFRLAQNKVADKLGLSFIKLEILARDYGDMVRGLFRQFS
jgi:hypothetical protein